MGGGKVGNMAKRKKEKRSTLTAEQRRLVTRIKRLHARREPLNITAVKRRHPDLMEAVYAVKPFWGWKRALEAAGIDYGDIRVEIEPYVQCRLCGEWFRALMGHLIKAHECDGNNYMTDYPDAPLVSEEGRDPPPKEEGNAAQRWGHWNLLVQIREA